MIDIVGKMPHKTLIHGHNITTISSRGLPGVPINAMMIWW
jgi:hypothetical protein